MTQRALYIAAYDVADPDRLQQALDILKDYAGGRQKSVFECFLTRSERAELIGRMDELLLPTQDRFMVLPLAASVGVRVLGIAVEPQDPDFYYVD